MGGYADGQDSDTQYVHAETQPTGQEKLLGLMGNSRLVFVRNVGSIDICKKKTHAVRYLCPHIIIIPQHLGLRMCSRVAVHQLSRLQ